MGLVKLKGCKSRSTFMAPWEKLHGGTGLTSQLTDMDSCHHQVHTPHVSH